MLLARQVVSSCPCKHDIFLMSTEKNFFHQPYHLLLLLNNSASDMESTVTSPPIKLTFFQSTSCVDWFTSNICRKQFCGYTKKTGKAMVLICVNMSPHLLTWKIINRTRLFDPMAFLIDCIFFRSRFPINTMRAGAVDRSQISALWDWS